MQVAVDDVDVDRPGRVGERDHPPVRRDGRHAGVQDRREIPPRVVGLDLGDRLDLGGEHVRDDRPDELVAVAEPPVHRRDPDTGAARHLVERDVGTQLREGRRGGGEDAFLVARGVQAQAALARRSASPSASSTACAR